jgi:anaerobic magnesium-protoporphyrin IX monomethyl ester cyclase
MGMGARAEETSNNIEHNGAGSIEIARALKRCIRSTTQKTANISFPAGGDIMRVLLCSQYYGDDSVFHSRQMVFPLGVAYIASMLKGHEVTVFDANVTPDPLGVLSRRLRAEQPEVVGLSLRNMESLGTYRFGKKNLSFYSHFRSMLRLIREAAPSCRIVVGGPGFSVFSREIMSENREIDFGVVSDGETTFANLLKDVDHPERARNLLVQGEDGVEFTGIGEPTIFDLLPSPSRELFDLSEYKKVPYSLNVQSKRGCAFGCFHCADPFLGNYVLQLRSASKVVDEVEELVNTYGVGSFWFVDSIFNCPPKHSSEICAEIRKRDLDVQWSAYFREDLLNVRLMREAVDAGCTSFVFHSDGACDQVLAFLGKKIRIADIERTIDMASQVEGAHVEYYFCTGLPRDNFRNMVALAKFTEKATFKCRRKPDSLYMMRLRIYPHTRLHEIAIREGKISRDANMLEPVFYESMPADLIQDFCTLVLTQSSSLIRRLFLAR